MNKNAILLVVLGIALGANMVMALWIGTQLMTPPTAVGSTVDSGSGITAAMGRLAGRGDGEALYLFDHESRKLVAYFIQGKSLELLAARDTQYDWRPSQYTPKGGRQIPSVEEMKEGTR